MRTIRIPATLRLEIPDLTVTLSHVSGNTILVSFSELVDPSFVITDIDVLNGTLDNFTGNGRDFYVDVTPTGESAAVHVPAGVAHAEDGRLNLESNRLVI